MINRELRCQSRNTVRCDCEWGEVVVIYCLMTKADVSVREAGYVRKGEGRCVPVIVIGQHPVKLSLVAFAF